MMLFQVFPQMSQQCDTTHFDLLLQTRTFRLLPLRLSLPARRAHPDQTVVRQRNIPGIRHHLKSPIRSTSPNTGQAGRSIESTGAEGSGRDRPLQNQTAARGRDRRSRTQFHHGFDGLRGGEKIRGCWNCAAINRLPAVMVISSGGARMQEGILSLMQMAKTAAAVRRLHERRMPLINVFSDPTTGGVTASLPCWATSLSPKRRADRFRRSPRHSADDRPGSASGFQTAEFFSIMECSIWSSRQNLKSILGTLLKIHQIRPYCGRRNPCPIKKPRKN